MNPFPRKKSAPAEDITLTLACNNACGFCPRTRLADVRVPGSRVSTVLEELRRRGDGVVLSGGEATLLEGFFGVVERCRDLGFKRVGLVTNGRRASDAGFAARMLRAGLNDIMVSVYSHRGHIHDAMTRRRGSCRQSWRGLANLLVLSRRMAGRARVRVNLLAAARNAGTLVGTVRKLGRLGVRDVLLMDVLTRDGRRIPDYRKIRGAWAALSRGGSAGARVRFRGYPPCVFAGLPRSARLSQEPMELRTTLGSDAGRLDRYLRGLGELYTKDLPECAACPMRRRCGGVQESYIRRYGRLGFRR